MAEPRLIFVGSSSEALSTAGAVAKVVERSRMEPLPWQSGFQPGEMLLERIERLPTDVQGAIMVATPDVICMRSGKRFRTPVANVIFEYGYLSGRLPRRTALLVFDGVDIFSGLSDLAGVKVITGGRWRSRGELHQNTRHRSPLGSTDCPAFPEGSPRRIEFMGTRDGGRSGTNSPAGGILR